MKYHFITFATENYRNHAKDICNSASSTGFDVVRIFTPNDLDENYKEKNAHILNNKSGAGFWIWKSYIILKYLYEIDKDDILCYCDSLYLFTGKVTIQEISQNIHGSGILITHNKPNEPQFLEKQYSKGDAFVLMNAMDDTFFETPQVWGGCVILRNSFSSLKVIAEWFTYVQDERIVTNSPSTIMSNTNHFIENRHDQTVLSLICKKNKIPLLDFPEDFLFNLRVPKG
jgi:hypothetical protein